MKLKGETTKEERKLMWTSGYTGGKQEKEVEGWKLRAEGCKQGKLSDKRHTWLLGVDEWWEEGRMWQSMNRRGAVSTLIGLVCEAGLL